jgi:2-haloalkanoic acid dehalogenase type II
LTFDYLTFDCYGTLIDWRRGIDASFGRLLGASPTKVLVFPLYAEYEAEEEGKYKPYFQVLKSTGKKVANHLGRSLTEDEATQFADSISSWPPFKDTAETLVELGGRGYKRVILSNIDRDILQTTIRVNHLEVDGFITAEDIGSYKPAPAHWQAFFQKYDADKNRTLHVAQSNYHDITPATNLGIATAWINRYEEKPPSTVSPTYVLNNLRSLLRILN